MKTSPKTRIEALRLRSDTRFVPNAGDTRLSEGMSAEAP